MAKNQNFLTAWQNLRPNDRQEIVYSLNNLAQAFHASAQLLGQLSQQALNDWKSTDVQAAQKVIDFLGLEAQSCNRNVPGPFAQIGGRTAASRVRELASNLLAVLKNG